MQSIAANAFRVGVYEEATRTALTELRRQFMKGARCHLCCARPAAWDLALSMGRAHLTLCPIDVLERAIANAAGADSWAARLVPAAANDSATGVVVGGSGGRS